MTKAKRREYYVQKWILARHSSVEGFYAKPSDRKIAIEYGIKSMMQSKQGKHYRVLGGNCFTFQCAYAFPKDGKWFLRVETQGNSFEYQLREYEVGITCLN